MVSFMFGYSYLKPKDGKIVEEIDLDDGIAASTPGLVRRPHMSAANP
ncbi:hypothetical protein AB7008_30915 [Bradyrhizobium sp. 521_C7_N1_3]|nr:hypothetical protein [Bradyrhizobium japonicum]WLB57671.1 hypothetical protein QIH94_17280 [Bradyrhizobium japonicum]WLB60463.1 hypothetical protein QIH96_28665 [Bradyrhizobium japonicum]